MIPERLNQKVNFFVHMVRKLEKTLMFCSVDGLDFKGLAVGREYVVRAQLRFQRVRSLRSLRKEERNKATHYKFDNRILFCKSDLFTFLHKILRLTMES